MTDIDKVISGLQRCKEANKLNCDKCPYDYNGRGNGKSECTAELATDALEWLKSYYTVANEKPFQCKDCAYYRKAECPLDKTSLFYGVLNFSCSAGIRKNRAVFHDSPNVHVACGMMPSVFSRDDDD